MNPTLEDLRKIDSETLNGMARQSDYENYKNGFSPDQNMRNYANSKSLQPGGYSDRHYTHLQPHPSQMTSLQQFLPPRHSLYQQTPLDPAFHTMFNLINAQHYDFNQYNQARHAIPGYSGLGQATSRMTPYELVNPDDLGFYNKRYQQVYSPNPMQDAHLMSRYQRSDEAYRGSYPRTNSVPNKTYPVNIGEISRGVISNGVKHAPSPIIDLTSAASPDNPRAGQIENSQARGNSHPNHSRSNFKDNGTRPPSGSLPGPATNKRRNSKSSHHYPHQSGSPYANLPPYQTPLGVPYSNHANHFESISVNDTHVSAKNTERGKSGVQHYYGSPAKRGTPPRPFVPSAKTGSPSSQFFTNVVQHDRSEITFNYPEASGGKYEGGAELAKRSAPIEGYARPPAERNQGWAKSDQSKLSAFENHVMDLARDGKPCPGFVGFDNARKSLPPEQRKPMSIPPGPIPETYNPSGVTVPTVKIDDVSRNSVIRNPEGLPSDPGVQLCDLDNRLPKVDDLSSPVVDSGRAVVDSRHLETRQVELGQCEQNRTGMEVTGGDYEVKNHRPESPVSKAEGARAKRRYVKRSKIWNTKGKGKSKTSSACQGEDVFSQVPNEVAQTPEPKTDMLPESKAPAAVSAKTARPQRKLTGLDMEEYLYGYVFTDEETENDDSSDEDYNCPSNVNNRVRITRQVPKPLRRTRHSARSQDDPNSECDERFESGVPQPRRRRRRKKIAAETDNAKSEAQPESFAPETTKSDVRGDVPHANHTDFELNEIENKQAESLGGCESTAGQGREIQPRAEIEAFPARDAVKSLSESITRQTVVDTVQQVDANVPAGTENLGLPRKKRKYNRKLDEYGNPVKRVRKSKTDEGEVKKRRKYVKKSEKWFKRKTEEVRDLGAPPVDGLQSGAQHVTPGDIVDTEKPNDGVGLVAFKKSGDLSITGENESLRQFKHDASVIPSDAFAEQMEIERVSGKENISQCDNINPNLKSDNSALSQPTAESNGDKANHEAPVKFRKKPGRKPGWRKHQAQDGRDAMADHVAKAAAKLRRKYRSAGDGLKRFGRRKRGRRGLRMKAPTPVDESNLVLPAPITSTPTSTRLDKDSDSHQKLKRKYDNSRRLEKKQKRLKQLGVLPESHPNKVTPTRCVNARTRNIHEISLELQNQEYEFDPKDVSWQSKPSVDASESTQEDGRLTEQPDAKSCADDLFIKPQTPTSSMAQSPFPPNMKKLSCNSAIGETSLHKAARLGYVENVQWYLETGASVNQCDNAGYTALHKACVHNNLEAATLLLEYGADVNKHAADGTRPFHDAVEYDHLEMARLVLACGADPMLSKFSGRAVMNMIRSEKMGNFMRAYLQELKEPIPSDEDRVEWKFPCSEIFHHRKSHHYSTLDFAPESEDLTIEFELHDRLPFTTYLLRPDDEHQWTNYCLLDDYLNSTKCRQNRHDTKIRIITMPTDKFLEQVRADKVQRTLYEESKCKPDTSGAVVEIVAIDQDLIAGMGCETVSIPLFGDPYTAGQEAHTKSTSSAVDHKSATEVPIENTTTADDTQDHIESVDTKEPEVS